MNWYKVFHGLPQDAKLALVARRAGLRRGEVLALWLLLLDSASRHAPRGTLPALDAEELAAALDFETPQVEAALAALRDKKMITAAGALAQWEKNQKLSTRRTRAHRARRRLQETDAARPQETDAIRRERLQGDMQARHRRQGRHLAADLPIRR